VPSRSRPPLQQTGCPRRSRTPRHLGGAGCRGRRNPGVRRSELRPARAGADESGPQRSGRARRRRRRRPGRRPAPGGDDRRDRPGSRPHGRRVQCRSQTDTRARCQRAGQQPTHDRILREASVLFARKGYGSTSTREIARAVSIQQRSLFDHFDSKAEVVQELLMHGLSLPRAAAERLAAEDHGEAEIARVDVAAVVVAALRLRSAPVARRSRSTTSQAGGRTTGARPFSHSPRTNARGLLPRLSPPIGSGA
jgi:AcrR family transcriptional regulator